MLEETLAPHILIKYNSVMCHVVSKHAVQVLQELRRLAEEIKFGPALTTVWSLSTLAHGGVKQLCENSERLPGSPVQEYWWNQDWYISN